MRYEFRQLGQFGWSNIDIAERFQRFCLLGMYLGGGGVCALESGLDALGSVAVLRVSL